eukprot:4821132-Prymnesium_polylepis.2
MWHIKNSQNPPLNLGVGSGRRRQHVSAAVRTCWDLLIAASARSRPECRENLENRTSLHDVHWHCHCLARRSGACCKSLLWLCTSGRRPGPRLLGFLLSLEELQTRDLDKFCHLDRILQAAPPTARKGVLHSQHHVDQARHDHLHCECEGQGEAEVGLLLGGTATQMNVVRPVERPDTKGVCASKGAESLRGPVLFEMRQALEGDANLAEV